MKKSTRYLFLLCIAAIAGVLTLQIYWISSYYRVNKTNFEKEVNLALEDAVKKEFAVRCDTIQRHIFQLLMDTTQYSLTVKYDNKKKTDIFTVADKLNPKDGNSFHSDSLHVQKEESNVAFRTRLAGYFARDIRISELEGHFVLYHTQKLGAFVLTQTRQYDFDTTRLRPIFKRLLADREIQEPFTFYLRVKDSTFNHSHFDPKISAVYPVISKAFITYKSSAKDHYIRALFHTPTHYLLSRMGILFVASVILIIIVAFSLFYLLRLLNREKKVSAIKNDFIRNITHEFKTPIATVSAAIEALISFQVLNDPEKTQRYLTHSKKELARLSALVDKVLNISLYENKQFDIKPENINIDEMINIILTDNAFNAYKPVKTTYTNLSGMKTLYADPLHFQHTVINVIDNAIKYSGNEVNIGLVCKIQQSYLVLSIQDDGKGISQDNLPLIFETFYRVPSSHHQVKGHGLGLSYVKSIMEKHNGWCKMDSELGKGSTFYLAWPV